MRIPPRAASPAKPAAPNPSKPGPVAAPTAPLPPTVVPAADLVVARSTELIAAGKHREAFPLLMEARARLNKVRDVRIEALLGRVALAEKVPEKALEFVGPYTVALDKLNPFAGEAYLVAGDANLALGKNQQALEIFDWLAGKAEGETVILAAEGCGKALMAMKDYAKAVEALQFAVNAQLPSAVQVRPADHFVYRSCIYERIGSLASEKQQGSRPCQHHRNDADLECGRKARFAGRRDHRLLAD